MIYFLTAAAAFAADRLSKAAVNRRVREGKRVTVVRDTLSLTNLKNFGAAGGVLAEYNRLLLATTLGSGLMMARAYRKLIRRYGGRMLKLSRALVFGGGAGNIYDRLGRKGVTDFVSFEKGPLKRIVFNAADVFIAVGGLIFAVKCVVIYLKEKLS